MNKQMIYQLSIHLFNFVNQDFVVVVTETQLKIT